MRRSSYLLRPLPSHGKRKGEPKIDMTQVEIYCCQAFQTLSPSEQNQDIENCLFFSEHVGKMFKEMFPFSKSEQNCQRSAFSDLTSLEEFEKAFKDFLEKSRISQNNALTKAKKEGKNSLIIFDTLFKGRDKTLGLTKIDNIVNRISQIHAIPPVVPILKIDYSLETYEYLERMGVFLNQNYVKEVTVPREFPSTIMGFSEFMVWSRLLDRLKITNLDKKLKEKVDYFF